MQIRKTLTDSSGHTLEGNTGYRVMQNLVIHGIKCVFNCKQINTVREDLNSQQWTNFEREQCLQTDVKPGHSMVQSDALICKQINAIKKHINSELWTNFGREHRIQTDVKPGHQWYRVCTYV